MEPTAGPIKVGIALSGVHPGLWREITTRAEELGYESVWLPEHLVLPEVMTGSPHDGHAHPPIPPQTPIYDAIVYLSYLAGLTNTIRLGTYVYNIGLRHPFVSARAAGNAKLQIGVTRQGSLSPSSACQHPTYAV